jgi:hypothetical protein
MRFQWDPLKWVARTPSPSFRPSFHSPELVSISIPDPIYLAGVKRLPCSMLRPPPLSFTSGFHEWNYIPPISLDSLLFQTPTSSVGWHHGTIPVSFVCWQHSHPFYFVLSPILRSYLTMSCQSTATVTKNVTVTPVSKNIGSLVKVR